MGKRHNPSRRRKAYAMELRRSLVPLGDAIDGPLKLQGRVRSSATNIFMIQVRNGSMDDPTPAIPSNLHVSPRPRKVSDDTIAEARARDGGAFIKTLPAKPAQGVKVFKLLSERPKK